MGQTDLTTHNSVTRLEIRAFVGGGGQALVMDLHAVTFLVFERDIDDGVGLMGVRTDGGRMRNIRL